MEHLEQDIWTKFGLKANPFDTRALSLAADSTLPITKAFVGRDDNSRESMFITNILRNPGGARFVIEGAVGVGKTSFVNYHRALWETKAVDKLLTPEEEIPVSIGWTVRDFLLNILGTLIDRLKNLPSGESHIKSDGILSEIALLSSVYRKDNYQFGGTIFSVGASFGKEESINIPFIPETQLTRYLRYLVRKVKEFGFAGIFLHLDNLELISQGQIAQARVLFENLRDTLQTSDIYFALVGHKGFFQDIIAPSERLKSVFFGRPIHLSPLSQKEVQEVFERRYTLLQMNGVSFIRPFNKDFIDYLYEIYRGKIRFIMEAVNTLVPFLAQKNPGTLSLEEAQLKLKEILTEEVIATVTPQEWEILKIAVHQEYFTNTDISKNLHIASGNVARTIKYLIQCQLVSPIGQEGRHIYYQVHEDVRIILDTFDTKVIGNYEGEKLSNVKKRMGRIWKSLKEKKSFNATEYASMAEVSINTARRDLNYLVELGKLGKEGKTKKLCYTVVSD